ncbi:MAG: PspC domain-containing protein [Clostridiales bacterium]|nr:PspC domain-containing protein [Clostridiales bacterium]
MKNKRLYKSSVNCMLCGVCGGIAEYFEIDPTLVRLAWAALTIFGGSGILAYIVAAMIIPRE